ncbi:MAG: 2-oxo-4-hydroxy-4-carboxy-5-ureidoimidazoline decarboxylase, partial [Pseudomonadota bacterium]|nr:2-oxo-4-hydroxy-4-carboxy-5-ureidoimidazoline decarboxylase [Pseudomonadota bacterium]
MRNPLQLFTKKRTPPVTLKELNTLSAEEASSWFEQCCAAKTWIYQMVKARPYSDKDALVNQAKSAWAKCS